MSFMEEIRQQPAAVQALTAYLRKNGSVISNQISALLNEHAINQIIFVGMGSSLFASYIPCTYLRRRGIRAYALEANEMQRFDAPIIDKHTLLVAVSQSGNSMETVRFCEEHRGHPLIVVTNQEKGNLSRYGAVKLFLQAGNEYCTATKSYTNTVAMLVYLAYALAGENEEAMSALYEDMDLCADWVQRILDTEQFGENLADFLADQPVLNLVGSGASNATVMHSQLVFTEAARVFPMPYTAGQFIHGPVEIIDEQFGCIIFDFDSRVQAEIDNVMDLTEKFGGKVILFTNRMDMVETDRRMVVKLPVENEYLAPLLEVVPVELMVYVIGTRKGLTPGELHRVHK